MSDEIVFEQLFKTYYSSLYFYAYHLIGDIEVSKDIVSDTFQYAWEHYDEISQDAFKSYLYTTVRNKSLNHLRHIKVREQYAEFCKHFTESSVEDEYREIDERTLRLRNALSSLPPRTRHILEECYVHKKKYKEVALELEISVSAIRKHIMKALRCIRDEFEK